MGWLWAMSIPGIVCLLVLLAALERFGLWAGRRSWLPGRKDRTRSSVTGAGFEEFGAFFYAGKRDELEHRKSELVMPETQTSGDRPTASVDPETGQIVYRFLGSSGRVTPGRGGYDAAMSSTERPNWAPESIDLDRPNAARIYDYLLGGAANFEQDRMFAEKVLEVMPEARDAARLNRAFLRRAVRFCVESGIRQFLDLGSGIPTAGNVHEIAQSLAPESRVLYVDSEPVAVTHSELLLRDNDKVEVIRADLADTDAILNSEAAQRLIDFDRPLALLMVSVLHFVPKSADPHRAVARYVEAMAPGSLLVLSHGVELTPSQRTAEVEKLYERSTSPGVRRTVDEVAAFYTGTELVEPGLVWTAQWRPESPEDVGEHPEVAMIYAGVGRKP